MKRKTYLLYHEKRKEKEPDPRSGAGGDPSDRSKARPVGKGTGENRVEQLMMLWEADNKNRERFDGLFFTWLRWRQDILNLLTSFDEQELRHNAIVQKICRKELDEEFMRR